jgi:hypothetical protein
MFKFLPATFAIDASQDAEMDAAYKDCMPQTSHSLWRSPTLLIATLTGVLFLTGCQQPSDTQPVTDNTQPAEKTSAEDNRPMAKSDSAAARIKQFEPRYVAQVQGLQRRLQAEYESLQAADASDSENSLLTGDPTADDSTNDNATSDINTESAVALTAPDVATDSESELNTEDDINTSTEVGERDLTVLKRISLEPRKPTMLTEDQIIDRYQQVMDALYQPVTTPLSAEDADTLINIATLVPELFEHAEIAGRVSAKSPALARLIIQHQVWEQIQDQQVVDMQQMKLNQQKEFEALMTKFNDTIQDYDEQIAKYEQTLREFQ